MKDGRREKNEEEEKREKGIRIGAEKELKQEGEGERVEVVDLLLLKGKEKKSE